MTGESGKATPRPMPDSAKRPRISVDVSPVVRHRLRLAAALALNARTDPVLAELWDNARDARYDAIDRELRRCLEL